MACMNNFTTLIADKDKISLFVCTNKEGDFTICKKAVTFNVTAFFTIRHFPQGYQRELQCVPPPRGFLRQAQRPPKQ